MKTISSAMRTHIQGETTSLCSCWKIVRQDGVILYFTDHDEDVVFSGNTYVASSGFMRSAVSDTATLAPDELMADGLLDSEAITEQDLRAGVYDYAEVHLFLVNWADPDTCGALNIRYGRFGECTITSQGIFKVELRGLVQQLSQTIGYTYTQECTADLGDSRCKIEVIPPVRKANTAYSAGAMVSVYADMSAKIATIPISNSGFESFNGTTFRPDDWTNVVNDVHVKTEWYQLTAREAGGHFVVVGDSTGTSSGGSGSASTPHITITGLGGLTTGDIDTGTFEIELSWWAANAEISSTTGVGISFYNGSSTLISTVAPEMVQTFPLREWQEKTRVVAVPAGTRSIAITLATGLKAGTNLVFASPKCGIDDVSAIIRPNSLTAASFLQTGGVAYTATVGGTTGTDTGSGWSRTLGDTIVDGGVTWTVTQATWTRLATVTGVTSRGKFTVSVMESDQFLQWGSAVFLTGPATGQRCDIISQVGNAITLAIPSALRFEVGDRVWLQAGCDKHVTTCHDKFSNEANFRGFPFMPGTDQYFRVGAPA